MTDHKLRPVNRNTIETQTGGPLARLFVFWLAWVIYASDSTSAGKLALV